MKPTAIGIMSPSLCLQTGPPWPAPSSSKPPTFTKSGAATLTLSGTNTYTGPTTGTLAVKLFLRVVTAEP
jgi:autotransporter-associated beta strand protein